MALYLIGIDDTDNQDSPGTGRLSRRLAAQICDWGGLLRGITRHQFLVDPRIPFTSHNSGACVAVEWRGAHAEIQVVFDLIAEWSAPGSDPGVCLALADDVPDEVCQWGWRATREVLTMDEARSIAARTHLELRALGGTGQGIVGALGSVGLRSDGNEGRFLDLPGLRDLSEVVTLPDLARVGVEVDHQYAESGAPALRSKQHQGSRYLTLGWVRPRLAGGKAVWPVQWSSEHDAWIPIDQKRSRPLE